VYHFLIMFLPLLLLLSAVDLFDGKTLKGWVNEGGANFRVENGTIVVDQGPYSWLRTEKVYRDYELWVEFKTAPDGNSGVFLRSAATGKPHETGYELQIFDERKNYKTGSLLDVAEAKESKIQPGWNSFHVRHVGPRVIVKMNGKEILNVEDRRSLSGHLGLQFNPGKPIAFRRIQVQEIK